MANKLVAADKFAKDFIESMIISIKDTWPLVNENSEDFKNLIIGMVGCFSIVDNSDYKPIDENGFIKIDNGE